jgi:hypothetical protein
VFNVMRSSYDGLHNHRGAVEKERLSIGFAPVAQAWHQTPIVALVRKADSFTSEHMAVRVTLISLPACAFAVYQRHQVDAFSRY